SPTAQPKRRSGTRSTTVLVVSHSPAAGWALRPVKRAPRHGPPLGSAQVADWSSVPKRDGAVMSVTSGHTAAGGAPTNTSVSVVGRSAKRTGGSPQLHD